MLYSQSQGDGRGQPRGRAIGDGVSAPIGLSAYTARV